MVKQSFIGKFRQEGLCAKGIRAIAQLGAYMGVRPGRCLYCAALPGTDSLGLCEVCSLGFAPRLEGYCPQCGIFFEQELEAPRLCGECLTSPPPYSQVFVYGEYAGVLQQAIVGYKYGGRNGMERLLLELMRATCRLHQERAQGTEYACVLPMPLHRSRLRKRGFNQSAELAKAVAKFWDIPLRMRDLVRTKNTTPQVGLSKAMRRQNVRGAFQVTAAGRARIAGRRVLLVDDVLTSGATAAEAAQACLDAGAARVDCFVVARALR